MACFRYVNANISTLKKTGVKITFSVPNPEWNCKPQRFEAFSQSFFDRFIFIVIMKSSSGSTAWWLAKRKTEIKFTHHFGTAVIFSFIFTFNSVFLLASNCYMFILGLSKPNGEECDFVNSQWIAQLSKNSQANFLEKCTLAQNNSQPKSHPQTTVVEQCRKRMMYLLNHPHFYMSKGTRQSQWLKQKKGGGGKVG